MTSPKKRSDLRFEKHHFPDPVELDCSVDISEDDFDSMEKAMPKEALDDEGILVSGERW